MAFATSLQQGQAPVCCNLCETETKIDWKCLPCNLFMCTNCKDKIHSKFKSADEHKIVNVMEVGLHSEEMDFSKIKCEDHGGQICVMFCKSCDQFVCTQCVSKVHNGHQLVDISEGYQVNLEQLKAGQTKAKVIINELSRTETKLGIIYNDEQRKFLDATKKIQAQNVALKKAVDKHTDKLMAELDKQWETIQKSIEKEQEKVKPLKQNLNDQIIQTEDFKNFNDAGKILCASKQLSQFLNAVQLFDVKLNFKSIPTFIPGEITQHNVGTLQEVSNSTNINMTISKAHITDMYSVYFLSTSCDGGLWISDQNVIQRVKSECDNLKVMSSYNMEIYGMALTPSNDLLLVTRNSPRIKQICDYSEQVTDSVYSVDPLCITAVHVSSDYKVIVGARTPGPPPFPATGRRVLITMNKEGKHENTYEHDRNKQPIFTYVRCITTTTNGTIFVVDRLSKDWRGRVVVLGQEGDDVNTYTGHPKINSDDKPFKPVEAVTTPLDNIIVTDPDTDTLHILNCLGHLMTYFLTNNIGIECPYSLSFTSSGHLYIGCAFIKTCLSLYTKKGKLNKVDMSQI